MWGWGTFSPVRREDSHSLEMLPEIAWFFPAGHWHFHNPSRLPRHPESQHARVNERARFPGPRCSFHLFVVFIFIHSTLSFLSLLSPCVIFLIFSFLLSYPYMICMLVFVRLKRK